MPLLSFFAKFGLLVVLFSPQHSRHRSRSCPIRAPTAVDLALAVSQTSSGDVPVATDFHTRGGPARGSPRGGWCLWPTGCQRRIKLSGTVTGRPATTAAKYVWEVRDPPENNYRHYLNEVAWACYRRRFTARDASALGRRLPGNFLGMVAAQGQTARGMGGRAWVGLSDAVFLSGVLLFFWHMQSAPGLFLSQVAPQGDLDQGSA